MFGIGKKKDDKNSDKIEEERRKIKKQAKNDRLN